MNLDKEQLHHIREFITQKGFNYVDVQMEILDHVASAVEERMNDNDTLSFDQALKETHQSFGVMGFSVISDGIINALSKKYSRVFWRKFATPFGPKYIVLIIASLFVLYKLQTMVANRMQFTIILISFIIILTFVTTVIGFRSRKFKKLMSYRIAKTYIPLGGVFLVNLSLYFGKVESGSIMGLNAYYVIVSIIFTLFMVYVYAGLSTAIKGVDESRLLMEKYNLVTAS